MGAHFLDRQFFFGPYCDAEDAQLSSCDRVVPRKMSRRHNPALSPTAFSATSRVATIQGEKPVADLTVGDLVLTRDRGFQPIRQLIPCTGRWSNASMWTVRLPVAAGGREALVVGARHGLLYRSPLAEVLFSETEVLLPAEALVDARRANWFSVRHGFPRIDVVLAEHALLLVEGIWIECATPHLTRPPGDILRDATLTRARLSRKEARLLL